MTRMRKSLPGREGGGRALKERKTFTLSRESIALLRDLRAAHEDSGRRSISAVLDDLLRSLSAQRKRESVAQATTRYYDNLSEPAHSEEREWGEFSLAQFMDGSG